VLIVEDEYFVGLSAEAALLDAGHEVLAIVTKGEEGVALAIEERPDLVVMDVRLAGDIDGIDAALQLAHHGIRCIFASAHSDEQTRARGDGARPIGWVTKPYSSRDLVSAIERGLGYRRES
jgi:DNA-binding response OmpR family regulator